MASGTRVGHPELHREIGAWNADTVIAPCIDDHVGTRRHVTFRASRAGRPGLVKVMLDGIVLPGRVALKANAVAWRAKLQAMWLVTVAARHSGMKHPALDERAVLVNFILNLSIRIIEVVIEQRDPIVIAHRLAMHVVFVNLTSPRMTSCTGLDFTLRAARRATDHVSGRSIGRPAHAMAFVQCNQEAVILLVPAPVAAPPRPHHMIGPGTMAGFAGDIDFGI